MISYCPYCNLTTRGHQYNCPCYENKFRIKHGLQFTVRFLPKTNNDETTRRDERQVILQDN